MGYDRTIAFRRRTRLACLTIVASLAETAFSGTTAHAQDRTCVAPYEQSQVLRQAGKLVASREQLLQCVAPACPELVRRDCETWLGEVTTALPSVVIRARDPKGRDLASVHVSVDGLAFVDELDGKAKTLDPGSHVFRYQMTGMQPVEDTVIIAEAQKSRLLIVDFKSTVLSESPSDSPSPSRARTVAGYTLLGVGALGLGSFAYFAANGMSQRGDLKSQCYPTCPESSVDEVRSKFLVGDISLGVGLVSIGIGTWVLLSSPKTGAPTTLGVRPQKEGILTELRGSF